MNYKHILILVFGVTIFRINPVVSQTDNDYMDLLLFYVDEKYDICFNKAMKYTLKKRRKRSTATYMFQKPVLK